MREWTQEERYRTILESNNNELEDLKQKVDSCPYRQKFHIQPTTGLLNDPNGFCYYNGEYHLFYQWFPYGPVHGVKHWYHVSSKDMVHWKDCGVGIIPTEYFESHGAFSGSGIVKDNKLYLFYTGNTRDENWIRHPYQCVAVMDSEGNIEKAEEPVIDNVPDGYTDNFRDPKVFMDNGKYYAVIGAERKEGNIGTILYYESENFTDWTLKGEIKNNFIGNGFMWECPDYFKINNKGVLVFSPQGLKPEGDKYKNIYQSGYMIGKPIDFSKGEFINNEFNELDRGFDFYAPQTTATADGRRVLVGWMGLPEIEYPSDENEWAHCLTIPRELSIKDDKLIQRPIKELELLRDKKITKSISLENEEVEIEGFSEKTYEVVCNLKDISGNRIGIKLRKSDNEETVFYYDMKNNKLVLDRSKSGSEFATEYGTERRSDFHGDSLKLQIYIDVSSVEIFINDGEEVFTSRIFTSESAQRLSLFAEGVGNADIDIWTIK
ncbi:sucrose-6-phosphate hydrolase [uncultured Clostridium sp.]|uniref:glycoside hydrolase family 32 protein n=1 Tax=uncultured Clostridium sp. TaxID=59620 RepID=UPI0025F17DDC|nr:sucrose-6-phosphate hydrolase [uncultured Clostridium sp.]